MTETTSATPTTSVTPATTAATAPANPNVTRNLPDHAFAQRLLKAAEPVWESGLVQPFLKELAAGTLSRERFTFYMLQDYLYLDEYANVHALAFAKTPSSDPTTRGHLAGALQSIAHERETVHEYYNDVFGITADQLANARQSAFSRAYTTNMIATAYTKPILEILVSVLPCAWLYADYGTRIAASLTPEQLDANPYKAWIDMYRTDEYWSTVTWLLDDIERLSAGQPEERLAELEREFVVGIEHEYMFWASAYDLQMRWRNDWDR